MADLVQAGNMGLMEAAKNYQDQSKRFSTYAAYYIKSAILREIENFRLIRLPENKGKEIRKAAAAVRYLEQGGHQNPGNVELARFVSWEPQKAKETLLLAKTSLPTGDEALILEAEDYRLDPAVLFMRKNRDSRCREALSTLPAREKAILELRYGFLDGRCQSMEETGKQLGITRQSVCEIEARAKKRLREALRNLRDTQSPGSLAA
jgi:RNA polymerase sigma factor (sigma-70 family)